MKFIGIFLLFIMLWLVVCMPQITAVLGLEDTSLKIAILHW